MAEFAEIAKVKVNRAGAIILNGAVWYAREQPDEDPPAAAMTVIQAIIEAQLPVKLLEEDR